MPVRDILARLQKVRGSGDQWVACCPAHEDGSPSLSIKELQDGRVLIHCHAGCGGADVMAAIGMSLSDLYPEGVVGEFKPNWHMRKDKQEKDHERRVLELAQQARASGKRLSAADLKREREAYLKCR